MNKKLLSLQGLRAIAALLVCCFHARMLLNGDFDYGIFFFGKGNIGVQLFFIISGFIMVYTTEPPPSQGLIRANFFFFKRLLRIVPLYVVLTLIIIIFSGAVAYYLKPSGFWELIRILAFVPIKNDTPLLVGWTLSYEMLFYVLFAFSLLFKKWRYYFLYALFFVFIFIIPLFSHKDFSLFHSEMNYFNFLWLNLATNGMMLFFVAGMIIGNTYKKIQLPNGISLVLLLVSILLFLAYYFGLFSFPLADLLFCSLLLFAVVHCEKSNESWHIPQFMVYLGEISYSIYLVHPIVIIFLPAFLTKLGMGAIADSQWIFLLVVLVTIFVSMCTHRFIEQKFTQFLRSRLLSAFRRI